MASRVTFQLRSGTVVARNPDGTIELWRERESNRSRHLRTAGTGPENSRRRSHDRPTIVETEGTDTAETCRAGRQSINRYLDAGNWRTDGPDFQRVQDWVEFHWNPTTEMCRCEKAERS